MSARVQPLTVHSRRLVKGVGPGREFSPGTASDITSTTPGERSRAEEGVQPPGTASDSIFPVMLSLPGVMDVLSEAVPGLTSFPGPVPFARCHGCNIRGCTRAELFPRSHSLSGVPRSHSPGVVNVLSETVPGLTSLPGPAPFISCCGYSVRGCTRADLSPRPCSVHQLSWVCCQRLYPS